MTRVLVAADLDDLMDHLEGWTTGQVWACRTAEEAWQLWQENPSRWTAVLTTFSHQHRVDLLGQEDDGPTPGCTPDATMTGLGLIAAIRRRTRMRGSTAPAGLRLVAVVTDGLAWGVDAMFASVAHTWFDSDVLDLSSPQAPRGLQLLEVMNDSFVEGFAPDGLDTRAATLLESLMAIQNSHGRSGRNGPKGTGPKGTGPKGTGPPGTVRNAVLYMQGNLRRQFQPSSVRSYLVLAFGHHAMDFAPPSKPTLRLRVETTFNALIAVAEAFGSKAWKAIDNPPGPFWTKSPAINGPRAFLAEAEEFFSYDDVVSAWREGAERSEFAAGLAEPDP